MVFWAYLLNHGSLNLGCVKSRVCYLRSAYKGVDKNKGQITKRCHDLTKQS